MIYSDDEIIKNFVAYGWTLTSLNNGLRDNLLGGIYDQNMTEFECKQYVDYILNECENEYNNMLAQAQDMFYKLIEQKLKNI